MPPAHATRREARAQDLLDAAIRVIRRVGAACSIDEVAAEVGVTRPIIYRYFGNRDGLASAVSARTVSEVRDALFRAIDGSPPGRDALHAAVRAYLGFIEAEPELYRYLIRGPLGRSKGDGLVRHPEFVVALGEELAAIIGEQLAAAGRDTGPAEAWAFALIGMIGAAGDWWLERRPMTRERLADYLTHMAWDGMSAAPTAPPNSATRPIGTKGTS